MGGVTALSCGEHFHLLRNGPPPLQSSTPGGAPGLQRWLSFPACRPRLDGGCTGPSSGLRPTGPLPHTVIHQLLRAPAPPPRTRISACPWLQPRGDSGRYEWVRPSWREGPRVAGGNSSPSPSRGSGCPVLCSSPRPAADAAAVCAALQEQCGGWGGLQSAREGLESVGADSCPSYTVHRGLYPASVSLSQPQAKRLHLLDPGNSLMYPVGRMPVCAA